MSAALTWLNDLIQWLGRWIPRFVLIHPTHRGVRFGPTGRAKATGSGLCFYWPITHDLIQIPITTQSQSITASHWKGDMKNLEWIQAARIELDAEMHKFGIQIDQLAVAGIGIGVAMKNISDWSYADDGQKRTQ